MTTAVPFDTNNRPPGGMPIEAALQNIASAAHLRGVEVTNAGIVVGSLPAADLMRALRGAWTKTKDAEHRGQRVEIIIRSVAARLMQGGPVQIAGSSLGVLRSFAGIKNGTPVRKLEADECAR